MTKYLGIDTSNYTTSAALYDCDDNSMIQVKKLLPVKEGQLGLRQSDAVFHHTKQLPEIIESLFESVTDFEISGVSASVKPRNIKGSYMPCFLCGEGLCRSLSSVYKIPMYATSHQIGHILAALYSAGRLDLVKERFIAFHVSGGTTDCLLCEPDSESVLKVSEICTSLDLKAGQAVDRVGLMLGLKFPCGVELEKLALTSVRTFKNRPVIKNGNCCLSGIENKCRKMFDEGENHADIAAFCLDYISETIIAMTNFAFSHFGRLPVIYAGGVMSDTIIKDKISRIFPDASFAEPCFSSDNAAGVAIYGFLKQNGV